MYEHADGFHVVKPFDLLLVDEVAGGLRCGGLVEFDCPVPPPPVQAIEDIPAGEPMVIDFRLGLAARPFDAERS